MAPRNTKLDDPGDLHHLPAGHSLTTAGEELLRGAIVNRTYGTHENLYI